MIRYSAAQTPRLNDGESPKLIALTTTYGLHVLKVTDHSLDNEDPEPTWRTACADAWSVETDDIVWWAYADEALAHLEAAPLLRQPK